MKTIVLSKPGEFALIQAEPPAQPAADVVLVRVRRIGTVDTVSPAETKVIKAVIEID